MKPMGKKNQQIYCTYKKEKNYLESCNKKPKLKYKDGSKRYKLVFLIIFLVSEIVFSFIKSLNSYKEIILFKFSSIY